MSTQVAISQSQIQSWGLIIKDCKESGLKVDDYCTQHNISRHTYYYWYNKVKKELYSQSGFVEIPSGSQAGTQLPANTASPAAKEVIEIHLNNLRISVPMNASAEVLSRIIEVASHAE